MATRFRGNKKYTDVFSKLPRVVEVFYYKGTELPNVINHSCEILPEFLVYQSRNHYEKRYNYVSDKYQLLAKFEVKYRLIK